MLQVKVPQGHIVVYGKKELRRALRASAQLVKRESVSLIRNSRGSGRNYGSHVASAPGQPPASNTGRLARSIITKMHRSGEGISVIDKAQSVSGSGAPYAKFLEIGAVGGGPGRRSKRSKGRKSTPTSRRVLQPRPFMSRAMREHEADIEKMILESVKADLDFK